MGDHRGTRHSDTVQIENTLSLAIEGHFHREQDSQLLNPEWSLPLSRFFILRNRTLLFSSEDVILVTDTGYDVLSEGMPYTVQEVESVMRQTSVIEAVDHRQR